MNVKWLESAINDLQALRLYIAKDNPIVAQRVVDRILKAVTFLINQPSLGRPGRIHNTRELIISGTPYIIPYRVKNNIVEILGVLHSAMEWSSQHTEQKLFEELEKL